MPRSGPCTRSPTSLGRAALTWRTFALAYGFGGPASQAGQLVRALQKESAEFAELWERHEVARRFEDHKILIHPEVGEIEFDCQALLTEDQSQALLILTAAPRTEAADKLALLRVLGQEQFTS